MMSLQFEAAARGAEREMRSLKAATPKVARLPKLGGKRSGAAVDDPVSASGGGSLQRVRRAAARGAAGSARRPPRRLSPERRAAVVLHEEEWNRHDPLLDALMRAPASRPLAARSEPRGARNYIERTTRALESAAAQRAHSQKMTAVFTGITRIQHRFRARAQSVRSRLSDELSAARLLASRAQLARVVAPVWRGTAVRRRRRRQFLCQRIGVVWSAFVARRRLCRSLKKEVRLALRDALAVPLHRIRELRPHNKREEVLIAFATECLVCPLPGSRRAQREAAEVVAVAKGSAAGAQEAPEEAAKEAARPKKLFEYIRCAEQLRLLRRKRERWHRQAQESDADRTRMQARANQLAAAAAARGASRRRGARGKRGAARREHSPCEESAPCDGGEGGREAPRGARSRRATRPLP